MKIKVRPEDFIVQEKATIPFKRGGDYKVYLLAKRGFNTMDLLSMISRRSRTSLQDISYGGKKDRHAQTSQFITIRGRRVQDLLEDSYSLEYKGEMARPMGPDLIDGNRFVITVRDLGTDEAMSALNTARRVSREGYLNYFDDQRFGSYIDGQGFIGERIVKGHFNGALKLYLTAVHPDDKKADKERKAAFLENWGDWEKCFGMAATPLEKKAFGIMSLRPKTNFYKAVLEIPREELSIFLSAYQSYIWNLVAERTLIGLGVPMVRYKGAHWDYLFYNDSGMDKLEYLRSLVLPTPSQNTRMLDEVTARIYSDILQENGLKPSSFNLKKIRSVFFKSYARPVVVRPEIGAKVDDDEIYEGRKRLVLTFDLPRGSYGTMLVKRLLAREQAYTKGP